MPNISALEASLAGAAALNAEYFGIGGLARKRGSFECRIFRHWGPRSLARQL